MAGALGVRGRMDRIEGRTLAPSQHWVKILVEGLGFRGLCEDFGVHVVVKRQSTRNSSRAPLIGL